MKINCLFASIATLAASASLAFGTTSAYTNAIIADHPVSFWPLNETSGTVIHDIVGTNKGTAMNTSGLTLGGPGFLYPKGVTTDTAIYFNNTNSGYINVPYSSTLNTPYFTVEAWLNMPVFPVTPTNMVNMNPLSFDYAELERGWAFEILDSNTSRPKTYGWIASPYWLQLNCGPTLQGQWSYNAMTYNGSIFCYYTNGVLNASAPNTNYNQVNTVLPLLIGAYNNAGISNGPTRFYQGGMENVAVYNYALTAGQIASHYYYG